MEMDASGEKWFETRKIAEAASVSELLKMLSISDVAVDSQLFKALALSGGMKYNEAEPLPQQQFHDIIKS